MNVKTKDKIATAIFYTIALFILSVLASLLGYVLIKGVPEISFKFLTTAPQTFKAGGGIGPQIWNSFYMLVITMLISIPIALFAGIYMAEYARKNWLTDFIRTTIEVLSSLPSIVVGLFGFLVFVIQLGWSFSILSGAITLTLFNLPLLIRVVEEALQAISKTQREAGLALGISKWETIMRILLPTALPALITGIILASGRVFGEAAALIFTAGQSSTALNFATLNPANPSSPFNIFRPAETLAVHIWKINGEGIVPDARAISDGASAVLIITILGFNLLARLFGKLIFKKMTSSS